MYVGSCGHSVLRKTKQNALLAHALQVFAAPLLQAPAQH